MKHSPLILAVLAGAIATGAADTPPANLKLAPRDETTLFYTTGTKGDKLVRLRVDHGKLKLVISFGGENHIDNEAIVSAGNSIVFECHAVKAVDAGDTGVSAVYQFIEPPNTANPNVPAQEKTMKELEEDTTAKTNAYTAAADAERTAKAVNKGDAVTAPQKQDLEKFVTAATAKLKKEMDDAKAALEAAKKKAGAGDKANATDGDKAFDRPGGN